MPTSPATMPPTAHDAMTSALVRPRIRAGMNSLIAEATAEYSPPTPRPVMNRGSGTGGRGARVAY